MKERTNPDSLEMKNAIETRGLTKRFRKTEAVAGLDLAVPEGRCYALLGPNGAGKTTTIKMLMNLIRPTAGTATVLGRDSRKLNVPEFQQIGYVSENQEQADWLTIGGLMKYLAPHYPSWDRDLCKRLLADFDLDPKKKIRSLSRGMKMKVALVSSIAYRPKLLVLDEPFSGLDPLVRDEFIQGVLETTDREGWTVFVSSHDIEEVERLTDTVGMLNNGRLMLSEPVDQLLDRFRRVEITFAAPQPFVIDQRRFPASWIGVEEGDDQIRFNESAWESEKILNGEVKGSFPESEARISVARLSLREIFLVLAREYRRAGRPSGRSEKEAESEK